MNDHDDDDEDVEDGEASESECPYCGSANECEHVLLLLDRTFRSAEGGALYEVFNDKWSAIVDEGESNPRFSERSAFDELREQVDALADGYDEYDFEGGPNGSSTYEVYYVKDKKSLKKALKIFSVTT